MTSRIDDFGGPNANNHYAVGWAHAMDTPYQWTKQVASHWGGTRNGMIVHWPAGIDAQGRAAHPVRPRHRRRPDRAGGRAPAAPDVRARHPAGTARGGQHAVLLRRRRRRRAARDAVLRDLRQPRHLPQGLDRGHPPLHPVGCAARNLPALDDDVWELYTPDDWTQAHNVAAEHPERLRDLQRLFLLEAGKYNVFPLDDRRYERFNSDLAGRPQLVKGNTQMLFGGMGRLSENSVINIKNKSHAVTADLTVAGRRRGRRDHRPRRPLRRLGPVRPRRQTGLLLQPARRAAVQDLRRHRRSTPGDHQVRMEFAYDGGGLGKGGTVTLYIDGNPVGEGRVDATQPMIFSADETTDLGSDSATPVSDDYNTKQQHLHRPGPLGPDRPRRRRRGRRPPHLPRRALPHRRRPAIAARALLTSPM